MKVIRDEIYQPLKLPEDFSHFFGSGSWATFDIETMGLSPAYHEIILVGFARPKENGMLEISQFFAEDPSQEAEVLKASQAYLDQVDTVITYNGASFDIPFFMKRCQRRYINPRIPFNLDILHLVKMDDILQNSVSNLRQKTIERFLGLSDREDLISGAESVDMYKSFVQTKAPELEEQILLHNHDDVQELAKVISIADRGFLPQLVCKRGLTMGPIQIESISIKNKKLEVRGKMTEDPVLIEAYEDGLGMHTSFSQQGFSLSLALSQIGNFLAVSEDKLRQINDLSADDMAFDFRDAQYLNKAALLMDKYLVLGPKNDWDKRAAAWLGKHLIERTMKKWKI